MVDNRLLSLEKQLIQSYHYNEATIFSVKTPVIPIVSRLPFKGISVHFCHCKTKRPDTMYRAFCNLLRHWKCERNALPFDKKDKKERSEYCYVEKDKEESSRLRRPSAPATAAIKPRPANATASPALSPVCGSVLALVWPFCWAL